jgi:hypothetical protein
MERRVDGTSPGTRCPQCGLAIKVTNQPIDTCPICGAKLPVVAAGKKGQPERKGPISLEQALFKSPRAKESWAPRDVFNAIMLTFFVIFAVNYLIIATVGSVDVNGQLIFDPALYFWINLAGVLVGSTPVLYVLLNKVSLSKIGLKKINGRQWLDVILFGLISGAILLLVELITSTLNRQIFLATGWDVFGRNVEYDDFVAAGGGNKLFMLVPVAAAQVAGELFYRGTILNAFLQRFQKHVPALGAAAVKLRAWGVSVLLGTLFEFGLFFNPATIIPSLLVHAIVGAIFVQTRNVYAGMIAQGTYILMVILFF